MFVPIVAVPAFPGAINSLVSLGLCFNFQAIACSLPPAPIKSTFINNQFCVKIEKMNVV
jgi:hypothetical protein